MVLEAPLRGPCKWKLKTLVPRQECCSLSILIVGEPHLGMIGPGRLEVNHFFIESRREAAPVALLTPLVIRLLVCHITYAVTP